MSKRFAAVPSHSCSLCCVYDGIVVATRYSRARLCDVLCMWGMRRMSAIWNIYERLRCLLLETINKNLYEMWTEGAVTRTRLVPYSLKCDVIFLFFFIIFKYKVRMQCEWNVRLLQPFNYNRKETERSWMAGQISIYYLLTHQFCHMTGPNFMAALFILMALLTIVAMAVFLHYHLEYLTTQLSVVKAKHLNWIYEFVCRTLPIDGNKTTPKIHWNHIK